MIGLLGAVLVVSGCASAPTAPPSPFPPRPKNIDLTNVDLCSTLTTEQKEQRGIGREYDELATVDGTPAPSCSWVDDDTRNRYSIQFLQGPASKSLVGTPGARVSVISGFGAIRGPNEDPWMIPETPAFCQIPIDTSESQQLRVQYSGGEGDGSKQAEHDAACDVAVRLAEDILGNLTR